MTGSRPASTRSSSGSSRRTRTTVSTGRAPSRLFAGVSIAVAVALTASAATWSALRFLFGGLRADPEHEQEGLDLAECGIPAYAVEPGATLEPQLR